ncbi:hypothetical protein [Streptomyces sp. MMG1121]|nr:hypothetical protein [Streptomyces sp. MMG1121]
MSRRRARPPGPLPEPKTTELRPLPADRLPDAVDRVARGSAFAGQ